MGNKLKRYLTAGLFPDWVPPKSRPPRRGHAGIPGTGPEGETCGTCEHLVATGRSRKRTYFKCGLARHRWTCGRATDVRFRDPACEQWRKEETSE